MMRDFTNGANCHSLNNPAGAIMATPKMNLVSTAPFIHDTNYNNIGSDINQPHPTITANRKWHYIVNPNWFNVNPSSIDVPHPTIIARQDKAPTYLTTAENGDVCILIFENDTPMIKKIKEFMALYGIADIFMRMLSIAELLRIQGFPTGYILKGTQTQQKKYIGNSVVPQVVKSMAEALTIKLREQLSIAA